MLSQRITETLVGLFLVAAILALVGLAFKVSGLTTFFKQDGYNVTAAFEDIGQLKVRGSVKIAGVTIGEITHIQIDPTTYKAIVTLHINSTVKDIPNDSSASILTAGLLGDNYVAISPMYSTDFLKNGDEIQETHSAMILEKLIGQFLFSLGHPSDKSTDSSTDTSTETPNKGAKK